MVVSEADFSSTTRRLRQTHRVTLQRTASQVITHAMERNETMIRLIFAASARAFYLLRLYAPTNLLLDAIRTRRGLRWGVPAMLVAVPYLLIANTCVQLVEDGGPGWLHLVVLWAIWCAFKMLWIGPISLVLLVRARIREAVEARRERADARTQHAATGMAGTC